MEDILYKPLEEVRQIQNSLLKKMIGLCFRGHPFYQKRFKEIGLREVDIQTIEDLEKLPPTFKKDYMSDPESFRLKVEDLPLPERILWDVVFTAGTSTGQPVPFYTTTHDFYATLYLQRKCGDIRGFKSTDIMANLYPLTPHPHGAFIRAINSATIMGCPIVSGLTGAPYPEFPVHNSIHDAIELVQRTKATLIWAVPSFLRKFLITADEKKADFSTIRLFALSGERVNEGLREELKMRASLVKIKDPIVSVSLGMTEMQAGCVECNELSGFHNPAPDLFFFEILDEKTHKRMPDGELGLLTLTHLNRRGTVLLRYILGDLTSLTHEKCPFCSRTSERIVANPVRVGELTKIRGMLVNKETLEEQLTSFSQIEEFQVVLTRVDPEDPYSMDEIVIRIAAPLSKEETLEKEITQKIKAATGVKPRLEFMDKDKIYDAQKMKMVRVIDIRKKRD
jgi:phenylacetate-coenzyme A ligase PaaK-like adenylate-forming protein